MHSLFKNPRYYLPFLVFALFIGLNWGKYSHSDIHISSPKLVSKALSAVQRDYFDRNRIKPEAMLEGALDQIEKRIPEIMADFKDSAVNVTVSVASKRFSTRNLKSLGDLRRKLEDVLAFIDTHYKGDTKKEEIEYTAIDGMLGSLDPHSSFLPPEIYKEFKVGTKGKFGGLGIVISLKDGNLTVIAPLDGTPAARAGIKAGDKIVQIGDESAINMSLTDAVNKLRGKVGTKIKIIIERPGRSMPILMTLTRALINIDSVQHEIIKSGEKKFGYLKIKNFQANTDDEVRHAFKNFSKKEAKIDGLILDMRNNPGGLLNQAIDLADVFLSKGIIVSTVGRGGIVLESDKAHKNNEDFTCPIVVLINEGSASASEIVAGAIKEQERGIVVGRRSFGKGSVQAIFEIAKDAAIKLTIAKYLPAGTYPIQSVGLTPDVELIPITIDKENMNLLEDTVVSERDLEKHLEDVGRIDNPTYRLKYVAPKEEEDIEKLSAREYAKKPVLKDDFAVELARQILNASAEPSRKEMLKGIKGVIGEIENKEEAKIVTQLKDLGIDWSGGKAKGVPQLKVAFNLLKGNRHVKEIRAGEDAFLELTATNVGNAPFYKLLGVGKSKSPLLNDKEFVFGKLNPGQTRSWKTQVKIPTPLPTEELNMEVGFQDEHATISTALDAIVPIKGIKPPRFGFSYKLRPNKIKTGKRIHFDVTVKNVGLGKSSKETVAMLVNKSGEKVYTEVGRVNIGRLSPGKSKKASLRFHVEPEFDKENIEFELTIWDASRIASLTRKIKINRETGQMDPKAKEFYAPPVIELEPHPVTTKASKWHLRGVINDKDGVKDYFVFVGSKKVAYVPNPQEGAKFPVDLILPLEPGNNIIIVAARDTNDLMGKILISINRTSGKKEEKQTLEVIPAIPNVTQ